MKIIKEDKVNFPMTKNPAMDAWMGVRECGDYAIYHISSFLIINSYAYGHVIEVARQNGQIITGVNRDEEVYLDSADVWLNDSYDRVKAEMDSFEKSLKEKADEAMVHLESFCEIFDSCPQAKLSDEQKKVLKKDSRFDYLRDFMSIILNSK